MNESPILLMAPLHGPTQQKLESAYTVHRLWEAPDAGALIASTARHGERGR